MIGERFGRLTVVALPDAIHAVCRCECGNETSPRCSDLKRGRTKSCGCWNRERFTSKGRRHAPEYYVWWTMKARCSNPARENYARYGGRGITVCERWSDFAAFLADMGARPTPQHSIERKDNDGPYSPENCVWATRREQQHNRRDTRRLTADGRTQSMYAWADERGIKVRTIEMRVRRGWTVARALGMLP